MGTNVFAERARIARGAEGFVVISRSSRVCARARSVLTGCVGARHRSLDDSQMRRRAVSRRGISPEIREPMYGSVKCPGSSSRG
nr:MAG: hypothetical protein DIU78_13210 [Pseudomonadota bacterium]